MLHRCNRCIERTDDAVASARGARDMRTRLPAPHLGGSSPAAPPVAPHPLLAPGPPHARAQLFLAWAHTARREGGIRLRMRAMAIRMARRTEVIVLQEWHRCAPHARACHPIIQWRAYRGRATHDAPLQPRDGPRSLSCRRGCATCSGFGCLLFAASCGEVLTSMCVRVHVYVSMPHAAC